MMARGDVGNSFTGFGIKTNLEQAAGELFGNIDYLNYISKFFWYF